MSVRKRNEFLEDEESEAESVSGGYDSEENEESRGMIGRRVSKRRKVEDEESEGDDRSLDGTDKMRQEELSKTADLDIANCNEEDSDNNFSNHMQTTSSGLLLQRSTSKEVAAAQKAAKAARRTGVVYISRIPPFMKPQTLRHFLLPHAPQGLGRLFLTPEPRTSHTARVKKGGNKKKSYTDGWVEFTSKTDAKRAVELLNGSIMGGKKGGWYHDDLWSLKYLRGFKWKDLQEQIAGENAERAARMREEIRRTRMENKAFVEDVERGKMLEGRAKKGKSSHNVDGGVDERRLGKKEFKQKAPQETRKDDESSSSTTRLQAMVFG